MKSKTLFVIASLLMVLSIAGCSKKEDKPTVLKSFPVENFDGVIAREGIEFDGGISSDGNGSLKIVAPESTTVHLYEAGGFDIEKARLVYRARVRTENVIGQVFLEMWCGFGEKGEYFSRGLNSLVTSNTEWTDTETSFYLKAGERPDNVKLDLVINGSGTVWIDDIKLVKYPLRWDER